MIKIETITDYINNTNYLNLINEIYNFINYDIKDYPNKYNWYYKKMIHGIIKGTRNILFAKENNRVILVACLKKEDNENKLCTIIIDKLYRHQGLGTKLFNESFKWLNTKQPLITFKINKLQTFKPFIIKYSWKLKEIDHDELIYN